jgi:adenosylmethionine-8-amino-7-oxononanoate aminotransferase
MYSTLKTGHTIMDACGVSIVGHGDAEVTKAVAEQMNKVAYTHGMMHTSDTAEELAGLLVEDPSLELEKAYFVSSGSEAMESAMKLAVSYHIANGEPDRAHFVSRKQSYHGNSIGAMNISTNLRRKAPYENAFGRLRVSHVSAACAYRDQLRGESEEQYVERLLGELEAEFRNVGTNKVAAFVAETVGGSTAGCLISPETYFERVRRLCSDYGILLILDEVMCGSGRTGTYYAFQAEGNVQPDLVTLGKGLAGGYLPIAAVLVRGKIHEVIEQGGGFVHGHTYQAHPVSCAAALAVQRTIKGRDVLLRCARFGAVLGERLREALLGLKYVGDIRGRGLFWAVEFVEDGRTKQPLRVEFGFAERLRGIAYDNGVALLSGSGTADGVRGDHIMIAPPLQIGNEELLSLVEVIRLAYIETEAAYDVCSSSEI